MTTERRTPSREFWEWFRQQYGDDKTSGVMSLTSEYVINPIIYEHYDYWKNNVLPVMENQKETLMYDPSAPLTPEEEHMRIVGAYLDSEVKAGRMSEVNFNLLFEEAETELEELGLRPDLKIFKDQNFKAFVKERKDRMEGAVSATEERAKARTKEYTGQQEEREATRRQKELEEVQYGEKALEKRRFEQDPEAQAQEAERVRVAELEDVDQYAPGFKPDIKASVGKYDPYSEQSIPILQSGLGQQYLSPLIKQAKGLGIDVSDIEGTQGARNLLENEETGAVGQRVIALQKRIADRGPQIRKEWDDLTIQAGVRKKKRSII